MVLVLVMEVVDLKQEEDDEGGDHQSENKGKRTQQRQGRGKKNRVKR